MGKLDDKKISIIETKYIDNINWKDITEDGIDTLRRSNDGKECIIIGLSKSNNWINNVSNVKIYDHPIIKNILKGPNWAEEKF